MNYNYSKLRGRIVEKYGTATAFAEALGTHKSQISAKLTNKIDITKSDIMEWSELLDINRNEIGEYFFCRESSES